MKKITVVLAALLLLTACENTPPPTPSTPPTPSVPESPRVLEAEKATVTILGEEYAISDTTSVSFYARRLGDEVLREIVPLLAKLTNLENLNLTANELTDISPLAELAALENLTYLSISANSVSDLSPLVALKGLTTLNIESGGITDISPLAELTALKRSTSTTTRSRTSLRCRG